MTQTPPTIDMRPDGTFNGPQRPGQAPFSVKLAIGAGMVAVLGGLLAIAALAIWFVSLILPVVIIAAAVAYGAMRFRRWRLGRNGGVGRRDVRGFR